MIDTHAMVLALVDEDDQGGDEDEDGKFLVLVHS